MPMPPLPLMQMCHPSGYPGPHHQPQQYRPHGHPDPSAMPPLPAVASASAPTLAPAPASQQQHMLLPPAHLPPGIKVPTPRAVSLEEGFDKPFAFAQEAHEEEETTGTSAPARPESVEPVVVQPSHPTNAAASAPAAADGAGGAPAPLPTDVNAMMLAAASAVAALGQTAPATTTTAGTVARPPEEDLAAYLMTLKHRSVSPDLVDDTASCLASMRMPHLMPGIAPNGAATATNAAGAASTGNSLNTTEGQVLRFRDTARTPGLPMATPEDRFWLSDVSSFVRQHCCEFFLAEGEEDNLTKTRSKSGKVSLLLGSCWLDLTLGLGFD